MSPQHLVRVDYVRKHYVGESWHPLYSPDYRWYYLNRQTKDEALLMKIYDSKEDVPARCKCMTRMESAGLHVILTRYRLFYRLSTLLLC